MERSCSHEWGRRNPSFWLEKSIISQFLSYKDAWFFSLSILSKARLLSILTPNSTASFQKTHSGQQEQPPWALASHVEHPEDSQWAPSGTGDTSIWPVTLQGRQNSCSVMAHRAAEHLHSHSLAHDTGATSPVVWGMTFATKDGGKHFPGPGSLLTPKIQAILSLRPHQSKFLQTDFKPNLTHSIRFIETSLLWENELYPYLFL